MILWEVLIFFLLRNWNWQGESPKKKKIKRNICVLAYLCGKFSFQFSINVWKPVTLWYYTTSALSCCIFFNVYFYVNPLPGSEIYQEALIKALAKHFDARVLIVDSLLLPGVISLLIIFCFVASVFYKYSIGKWCRAPAPPWSLEKHQYFIINKMIGLKLVRLRTSVGSVYTVPPVSLQLFGTERKGKFLLNLRKYSSSQSELKG